MKKTSKNIMKMYSILLASAMMLSLTACGNTETSSANDGKQIAAAANEVGEEEVVEAAEVVADETEEADETEDSTDSKKDNKEKKTKKEANKDSSSNDDKTKSSKSGKSGSTGKTDKSSGSSDEGSSDSAPGGSPDGTPPDGAPGGAPGGGSDSGSADESGTASTIISSDGKTYTNSTDGEHAIEADGTTVSYSDITVNKTGDSSGDESDFYGKNSAIYAKNGASLTLKNITVDTAGTHANGVFSYGSGTTVTISDSTINTTGNCSGGLMTTGGGTMIANNLTIHTTGNSSAAIRSDRGGGTVKVTKGTYTTDGKGSPVIYSTADITVSDATLTSTSSQGVVVEGKNSVTLNNVELTADNNSKNSDKSDTYQAVMIYQSMSGDADEGTASFKATGGSITNKNGDVFFVNNTAATIELEDVDITNEDSDGVFLRAEAAGWGTEGSNGGDVTLTATDQDIDGDIIVDDVSSLDMTLTDGSTFTGSINSDGAAGEVNVTISADSTWNLTDDSYITSLDANESSVNLNGYSLYINGSAY